MTKLPDNFDAKLRAAMARQILDIFEQGMPVTDKEGNATGERVPPPAAFFAVGMKLLAVLRGKLPDGNAEPGSIADELKNIGQRAAEAGTKT